MNAPIRGSHPLSTEEILFTDGTSLKDRLVFLCGDFVIVSSEGDEAPTMYNSSIIQEIRNVKEILPKTRFG